MTPNVEKELAALRRMTPKELAEKYAEVFGEQTRSKHKQWLVKRIIWRMQANAEGDLSERARRRAMELANDADLRVHAPRSPMPAADAESRTRRVTVRSTHDGRVPLPGTVLTREYKGELLRVNVLADGFEYEGQRYKSLSAIAKAVTGSHMNGYRFFRLGEFAEARA